MIKRRLLWSMLVALLGFGLLPTLGIAAQDAVVLEFSVPVSGEFTDEQPSQMFTFTGAVGDVVYVSLMSPTGSIDAEMRLLGPDNRVVAEGGYGGAGYVIGPLTLALDGEYTILAEQPGWSESSGEYRIMVDSAVFVPLDWGVEQIGHLDNPNSLLFFTFDVEIGDLAAIEMRGEAVGFVLYTPFSDFALSEGHYDDLGIPLYQFMERGTYTLSVQTINEDGSDYTLTVRAIDPIPLLSGQVASGNINSGELLFFSFDSLLGKTWQIDAILPETGDRYMFVYQLDGREFWDARIAVDYGNGPNGNPRIAPFVAPGSTPYYVGLWFESWEGESSAPYEVSLGPSTVLSLAPGTKIGATVSPDTGDMTYVYNGLAGEIIQVTITRVSDGGALRLGVYSAADEVVVFDGRSAVSASFEIELPLDGVYQFIVSNISYEDAEMEFSLLLEQITQ